MSERAPHLSLGRLFASGRDPQMIVARNEQGDVRFGQFARDVAASRDLVIAHGATTVAVLGSDAYRFAVGIFGSLHAGARALVPPNALPATIATIAPHVDLLFDDSGIAAPVRSCPTAIGSAAAATDLPALDTNQAIIEFFTSGTTGTPKRVPKSLYEIDHDLRLFDRAWGAELAGRTMHSTVPYLHFFGLTFHLCWPLAAGRPFWTAVDEFWEPLLARQRGGDILVSSPGHLQRLSGIAPLAEDRRFSHIFVGGAPLSVPAAAEAGEILGALPIEMLGSTETGPMGTRQQRGTNEPWRPMPGLEITANAEGCAVVRWPDDPQTPPFETADRIEILADGRFHLLGRADLIVKIEGKRVSLLEVEAALQRLPQIAEAAAIDLNQPTAELVAVIVLSPQGRTELAELGAFRLGRALRRGIAGSLEPAAQPRRWRFVEALPRRALGKRDNPALRALFARAEDGR